MSLVIKAKIIRTIFKRDDYRIYACSPMKIYEDLKLNSYNNFTISGELSYLDEGSEYELEIEEDNNSKYPCSYTVVKVTDLDIGELDDEKELEILKTITTDSQAEYVHKAYPNFIRLILEGREDEIDLNNIYNVGETRFSAYKNEINTKYKYYQIMQDLKDYKINVSEAKKLFNVYTFKDKILSEIEENPYYIMTEILERSFNKTDRLILESRPELKDSNIRCEAITADVLKRNELDGNTRLNGNLLWNVMLDDYNAPKEWAKVIKNITKDSTYIYYDEKSKDLARTETYVNEATIANFIKKKLKNPIVWDFKWERFKKIKEGTLTDEQSNVLKMLCENNIVILNASAGCGKTSSMLAVINILECYGKTYKCITATGKAAKRLSESINGRPASTIHRSCLGDNKIISDVLIIDEHSFLSVDLMMMIINAIDNDNMKILMIGDIEQIPNLSLGKPIRDMIDSGIVPVCTLTKCFRFGIGGISTVSTMARQGEKYLDINKMTDNGLFVGQNKDYQFIPFNNTMDQIVNCYDKIVKKNKLNPIDICVISPYNIGEFGTININNAIQELVNPPKPKEEVIINEFVRNGKTYKIVFRIGDIVMNTVNNYKMLTEEIYNMLNSEYHGNEDIIEITKDDVPHVSCMNGEIGKILDIKDGILKIKFDEEIIVFDKYSAKNLLLAYSSNPYKLQGSQCNWIINLSIKEHKRSLNRQMLYTSLTRAKDGLVEIGELDVINNAIDTLGDVHRNTWLREMLLEG